MNSDCHLRLADSESKPHQASRRQFLWYLLLSAAASRNVQGAAKTGSVRVGWLALRESIFKEPYSQAFISRLNELGFTEGTNLILDRVDAGDRIERMAEAAKRLVDLRPDVIFSGGGEGAFLALKHASRDIPTIFVSVDFDPVKAGHIARMSRPDGAITGISGNQSQLPAKRLELLKALLPKTKKVAVFSNSETLGQLSVAQAAAEVIGVTLEVIDFRSPPFNFERAFESAARARSDALLVLGSSLFVSARNKIPQLALAHRLPTVCHQAQWAEAGALMSYGFSFISMWRTGADMTSKALRRVPVAEIPMEIPSTYELAINLTTAKLLGIDIPYELRLRADKLIG